MTSAIAAPSHWRSGAGTATAVRGIATRTLTGTGMADTQRVTRSSKTLTDSGLRLNQRL
jgi:hypothetical protein